MLNNPKVILVTPTFNSEDFIEGCLSASVKQLYDNFEHWIFDGGSKDQTVSIAERIAELSDKIHVVQEPDKGIYNAMNNAIKKTSGDYYIFLGADDRLYNENSLKDVFEQEHIKDYDFIYGKTHFQQRDVILGEEFKTEYFIEYSMNHQSIAYGKKVFEKIGLYNEEYKMHADWDLNMKCWANIEIKKKFVDVPISSFNEEGASSVIHDKAFHRDLPSIFFSLFSNSIPNKNLKMIKEKIGSIGLKQIQEGYFEIGISKVKQDLKGKKMFYIPRIIFGRIKSIFS